MRARALVRVRVRVRALARVRARAQSTVVEQAGCGEEAEADRLAGGVVVEHAVGVGLDPEQQAEQRL